MLELSNITIGYKERLLVENLTLAAKKGEFIALLGRNGTGKSTLLRAMAGLAKPLVGDIIYDNKSIYTLKPKARAALISFVSTENINTAHLRVWDVVAMGRSIYSSWSGALSDNDKKIIEDALIAVGMLSFSPKTIDSLSDGERQRVMIARALAQESPIILLDEPTAFLDMPNRYHIVNLLKDLATTKGKTIILSTHELTLAKDTAHSLWIINKGTVIAGDTHNENILSTLENIMRF